MRSRLAAILSLVVLLGCFSEAHLPSQPVPVSYSNPMLLNIQDPDLLWDGIHDVLSQYFRIEDERPIQRAGDTFLNGWLYASPKTGATLLEPWDHDSADCYQRLECTLQSIRRYAVVRVEVHPAENGSYGFWVDVAVYKELENVRQPEHATAGSATFRNDVSPNRGATPGPPAGANQGWIPQGRDAAAEQLILGQILTRFTPEGKPIPVN
jgi:hypothetical protein